MRWYCLQFNHSSLNKKKKKTIQVREGGSSSLDLRWSKISQKNKIKMLLTVSHRKNNFILPPIRGTRYNIFCQFRDFVFAIKLIRLSHCLNLGFHWQLGFSEWDSSYSWPGIGTLAEIGIADSFPYGILLFQWVQFFFFLTLIIVST